jgi:hypothetical protein
VPEADPAYRASSSSESALQVGELLSAGTPLPRATTALGDR